MSNTSKSWITPTYQANLNLAIHAVITALNEYNLLAAWQALRTLFAFCPKKVKEELKDEFVEAQRALDNILLKRSVDLITTQGTKQRSVNDYLDKKVMELFEKLKDMLEEKGYLEPKYKAVDSNVAPELFASLPLADRDSNR